jgi:hypothetical protein
MTAAASPMITGHVPFIPEPIDSYLSTTDGILKYQFVSI